MNFNFRGEIEIEFQFHQFKIQFFQFSLHWLQLDRARVDRGGGFFLGGGLRRLPRRCRGLGTSRSHRGSCTLAELMLAAGGGGGGRCVWEGYVLEQRIFFA